VIYLKSVIKYHGSKWRIADWIIYYMPFHHSYLEPYFGSEAVFFNKQPWDQARRQRLRTLLLVLKVKLETVNCGICCFEQEFMANIVLPDNHTVGEFMLPQIQQAYEKGTMPAFLPMLEGK
jgi:hypothetical protein